MKRQRVTGPKINRTTTIQLTRGDSNEGEEGERSVTLSFSSAEPYTRASFFEEPWVEVLGHKSENVDLRRLNGGAPLLLDHDTRSRSSQIGIVERAWVEDGRGYADVRLSKRAEVDDVWRDIQDGILRNVSVGYKIHERTLARENKDGPDEYNVTRWEPLEVSILGVPPADATVGIGRSDADEGTFVIEDIEEEPVATDQRDDNQAVEPPAQEPIDTAAIEERAAADALKRDTQRRTKVRGVFSPFLERDGIQPLLDAALDDHSITVDDARAQLLEALGRDAEPVAGRARIETGPSEQENFRAGVEMSILERTGYYDEPGVERPADLEQNRWRGYTLMELARMSCERMNQPTNGGKMDVVGRAISHSSSDFPILLQNVANKAMLRGWDENAETFEAWTNRGTLPDFKEQTRVDMNLYPNLPLLPEGAEYTYATIGERQEKILLGTHGSIFSITRQAIINDDMSMFSRVPRRQGRAASRTVADAVYAQLTSNPLMSDGTALFDATHGNLAASGNPPTTQTVDAGRVAMGTQRDPDAIATGALNIRPVYALVPMALEGEMRTVIESQYEVRSGSNRNHTTPNSVRGLVNVISDARLDLDSTTAWYLVASPGQHDTVEVSYLDGHSRPFLDQKQGWNVDGAEFKVRIDFGVKALDWKTFYKDPGA